MQADQSIEGALSPPPGITPNFANPDYFSGGIIPISAVFLTLSTLFLALRVYTRVRLLRAFFADDYVIIAAWVLNAASTATCLEQQNNGNGRHLWDIPLNTFVLYLKWAPASEILYVPATALPKVAILISYMRIFPDRNFRIVVYTVLFITLGYMTAICLVIFFFRCQPIAKSWNLALPGHCILVTPYLSNGILNVVTDFVVLLVPVPMLVWWEAPTRRKLVTGCVFATGTLTCILSAVRTYFVSRMQYTADLSRAVVIPTSLSVAETNLAVICGCLMVALPFLRRHLPFLLGSNSERIEQTDSHVVDNERPTARLNIPFEHRAETSAGFRVVNSSAGWIWHQRSSEIDTSATIGTAAEDLEMGGERAWPLRNDLPPMTERGDNSVEEM